MRCPKTVSKMLLIGCPDLLSNLRANAKTMSCPTLRTLFTTDLATVNFVLPLSSVNVNSPDPDTGGAVPGTAGLRSVNLVLTTRYPNGWSTDELDATQIQNGISSGSMLYSGNRFALRFF